jgi:predicted aminopeptidase
MILLQKQRKEKRKRIIRTSIILLIICFLIWQKSWVQYFYQQATGGLTIAFNTRSLKTVLEDKYIPDSLKKRILYIQEVRKYAIDSLGLHDNPKVYQTLYDQNGQPLVHLLTVAEPYKMEAKEFDYPMVSWFIGKFTYKGFFDSTTAIKEQISWKSKGYDTEMGQGIAYSTLGWLPEPILSNMLYYPDGKLASLIIHEMTHGTIFVKSDHETSENLANFIGDYGAKRFLKYKYGSDSKQFTKFKQAKVFRDSFVKHLNRGTLKLDSLYKTFLPNFTSRYKDSLKYSLIEKIEQSQDTIYRQLPNLPKYRLKKKDLPNNAYFVSFKTYNSKQNEFENIFEIKFPNDFEGFLTYLIKKYNR